jgi:hypothetical protein
VNGFRMIPELWFVAYNVVFSRYRACCYLCGWWSLSTENAWQAEVWLTEHVGEEPHLDLAADLLGEDDA